MIKKVLFFVILNIFFLRNFFILAAKDIVQNVEKTENKRINYFITPGIRQIESGGSAEENLCYEYYCNFNYNLGQIYYDFTYAHFKDDQTSNGADLYNQIDHNELAFNIGYLPEDYLELYCLYAFNYGESSYLSHNLNTEGLFLIDKFSIAFIYDFYYIYYEFDMPTMGAPNHETVFTDYYISNLIHSLSAELTYEVTELFSVDFTLEYRWEYFKSSASLYINSSNGPIDYFNPTNYLETHTVTGRIGSNLILFDKLYLSFGGTIGRDSDNINICGYDISSSLEFYDRVNFSSSYIYTYYGLSSDESSGDPVTGEKTSLYQQDSYSFVCDLSVKF